MSARIRKKTAILIVAIAVSMAAAGFLLSGMQERLAISNYDTEMDQDIAELPGLLQQAEEETAANTETFDAIYQSKAESIAFIANNNAGFEATDAKMAEYRELLGVDNVAVVKESGQVVAAAERVDVDFADGAFDVLRETLATGKASDAVEISVPATGGDMRFYAAPLDGETMLVVEQSPSELDELTESTGSAAGVLSGITVGQHGYVMAVSASDYSIAYHPERALVGASAVDAGMKAADLVDGNRFSTALDGEAVYCGVAEFDGTYYVCVVPESDMASSRGVTVGVILFAFLAVMATVALYGVFVMREDERTGKGETTRAFGRYRYNQAVGKKAIVLSVVGFVVVVCVSFYMQTLFALSSQSLANSDRAAEVSATIAENDDRAAALTEQYGVRYTSKCHVAEYILSHNPALATREKLHELAGVLQVTTIYVYDGDGVMTASSTSQKSYALSTQYGDSSYEFRALLGGKDEYVQEPSINRTTGEIAQYIGVAMYDENGIANGIVQISVRPTRLETLLNSVRIDHVLDGVKAGADGFAFAVSKEDGTVAYYPSDKIQGKQATAVGLAEGQMKDGYSDYISVGGQRLFANCVETDDYYLFVAGPEGGLMAQRGPLTIATGVIALACLAFIFIVLSLEAVSSAPAAEAEPKPSKRAAARQARADAIAREEGRRVIDVTTVDGRTKRSESAVSRWLNSSIGWDEKSPEQKLSAVVRWIMGAFAFLVCAAVVFQDDIFATQSVFSYILAGGWEHGLNIFAFTAAIMYACVAVSVAAVIQWLLRLLAGALGARGETVCRLLSSVVKYGTVIFMLYWCLGVLGVDTATLVASLGIITLALSFGAKDLITDILSGLFIIFEGEFRVGDIIQVGGNTGTVMEIGVRTTKIKNGAGDVLVLRNSGISNVVNKTKLDSYANVDVVVPTGESLPYVENVLATELPRVRNRVPEIIDGPFYKGVVALTDASMTLRVVATCAERDRATLERALKREMKLLLSRNDIAPYQLSFEHGSDVERVRKATDAELETADEFRKNQEEASRNVGNDASK